jgi:SpoVK/Ycf46/Vps4 family AAA+-type ATPase
MKESFLSKILSGTPLMWVVTHEEFRALSEYCEELKNSKASYNTYTWDAIDGIKPVSITDGKLAYGQPLTKKDEDGEDGAPTTGIIDGLNWLEKEAGDNTILFLKDYHHYFRQECDVHPLVIRKIRNVLTKFESCGKTVVIIDPKLLIPDDIEKEVSVINFSLPDREQLRKVLKSICEDNSCPYPSDDEPIIDAATGMTQREAVNAFAHSLVLHQKFDAETIRRAKAEIVKKDNLLEVVESKESLDSIGGLENMKAYLIEEHASHTEEARDFGADPDKGMLLIGVPGNGKSLTAKAVATAWQRPLLRMDVGNMFGKYVGESESRLRQAEKIAEAIAPCVLWIDELEKSFAGSRGDNEGHGTTSRVFQNFLTWLSEKTADVFIVATANDVEKLPQELIRSGRIDAIFWVDNPTAKCREDILRIHLKKRGRDPELFKGKDLEKLMEVSKDMSGAGIEAWVKAAVKRAYALGHEQVELQDFLDRADKIQKVPGTAKARRYAVEKLNAQLASEVEPEEEKKTTGRKIQSGGDSKPKGGDKGKPYA